MDATDSILGTDIEDDTCILVVTGDHATSASVATVNPVTLEVNAQLTTLYADTVIRVFGERVFALERLGADTITELSAEDRLAVVSQRSLGRRSNPWDMLPVAGERAWVALYGEDRLARVTLDTNAPLLDGVDIALGEWAVDGGQALPAMLLEQDADILVILQRLRRFSCVPGETGMLLSIPRALLDGDGAAANTTTIEATALSFCNPVTALVVPDGVLVGSAGDYRSRGRTEDDGGVEWLGRDGSRRVVLTEADLGDRDVVLLRASGTPDEVWVLAADADFHASVLRLDVASGQVVGGAVWASEGARDLLQIGDVLWVADGGPESPGLRRFDAATGEALDPPVIRVGGAPIQLIAGPSSACRGAP